MKKLETDNQKIAYASYIKSHLKKPKDWKMASENNFSPTLTDLHKYFIRLIEDKNKSKTDALSTFFDLKDSERQGKIERLKKEEGLKNKIKSIANFIKHDTIPRKDTLNFIAVIFDISPNNFESFKVFQESEHENSTRFKIYGFYLILLGKIKRYPVLYSAIFLVIGLAGFFQLDLLKKYVMMKNKVEKVKTVMKDLENIAFKPEFVLGEFLETDNKTQKESEHKQTMAASISPKLSGTQKEAGDMLAYHTNTLSNHQFIYSSKPWTFAIDSITGEDINGKYGRLYSDKIQSVRPREAVRTTLANQSLTIRFNVHNQSDAELFIDGINIEIIATYAIDEHTTTYSVWKPKALEKRHEITFSDNKHHYPIETFIELASQKFSHITLKITGDGSCDNLIHKFRITINCNDGKGKHYTIHSDKSYFIGFLYPFSDFDND